MLHNGSRRLTAAGGSLPILKYVFLIHVESNTLPESSTLDLVDVKAVGLL